MWGQEQVRGRDGKTRALRLLVGGEFWRKVYRVLSLLFSRFRVGRGVPRCGPESMLHSLL